MAADVQYHQQRERGGGGDGDADGVGAVGEDVYIQDGEDGIHRRPIMEEDNERRRHLRLYDDRLGYCSPEVRSMHDI